MLARDQRHQDKLLAPEFGGDPHRHFGLDGAPRFRAQTGTGANQRRNEGVEGEDRRGREARQYRERLAVDNGEAQRFARLKRDTVYDYARRAEPRYHPMTEVAGAFRGAATKQHDIAAR